MVWAIIVFVSVVAFVLVAKSNKQTQQSSASIQVPVTIEPGIPTLSALLGQNPQIKFDAKRFFALAHYSPVTAEIEKNIRIIAQQNAPNDKEAYYPRFIGVAVVAYPHDVSWFTIYGQSTGSISRVEFSGSNSCRRFEEALRQGG